MCYNGDRNKKLDHIEFIDTGPFKKRFRIHFPTCKQKKCANSMHG